MDFKSRVVPGVLIGGLVLAGGGSVIAASGGSSSNGSSSKEQYCPPNSPNAGQPQGGPGNNCGNPPDKCPNGQPKPPGGNCGQGQGGNGNGNGNGKKCKGKGKGKGNARFCVKRLPAKRCYSKTFKLRVHTVNKGKGRRVFVYRDGHKVKKSRKTKFVLTLNVRNLKPGVHKIKVRARGTNGKWSTRTVKFRRC